MHLFIHVCLCRRVCCCVFLPDGSAKKNFSGESRNRDRSQRASSDPQLKELCSSHRLEQPVNTHRTPSHESPSLVRVNSNNQRSPDVLMLTVILLQVTLLALR